MFGIMEALLSFVRRQVGLRTDAANSTGSLHAKVAELRTYINTIVTAAINALAASTTKNPRFATFTGTMGSTSSATIANVSGAGWITGLNTFIKAGTNPSLMKLVITIDGAVRLDTTDGGLGNISDGWESFAIPMMHRFNNSFSIVLSYSGSNSVTVGAQTSYILS